MQTWVNGRLLGDPDAPVIAANDHGLTVGDGVFEAVKVVGGQPFALTRHLQRLARSARAVGLPAPDLGVVGEAVETVLAAEHLPLGRLRLTYTAGPGPLGSGRGDARPTLIVVAAQMPAAGASAHVVPVPWPRNERGALAGVKSTSYAENVVALAQAARLGATEAIFENLRGHLCEGTGSNVGYVVGGEARTPTLTSGCLAGVTRALLLEWSEGAIREVDEPIGVLQTAEEIFLLSTTRDVQPVRRYGDRHLDAPGPVTRWLQSLWSSHESKNADP